MNPAAILALIGDLYAQVSALTAENERLNRERDDLLQRTDHTPDSSA